MDEEITAPVVLVLDVQHKPIGEMAIADAIAYARQRRCRLIDIGTYMVPPACLMIPAPIAELWAAGSILPPDGGAGSTGAGVPTRPKPPALSGSDAAKPERRSAQDHTDLTTS